MKEEKNYLIVDSRIAPDIFNKVIQVKKLIETGKSEKINDAVKTIGISRSAYYKYKDYVFRYYKMNDSQLATVYMVLDDYTGVLANILKILAKRKANILTINQNIPIGGLATVTMSIRMPSSPGTVDRIIEKIKEVEGVEKAKVIAIGENIVTKEVEQ